MMIVLSILKILGIILLIVLILAIVLIFLVLFVPIRYSAQGRIQDPDPHETPPNFSEIKDTASGWFRFHWLLHLIRGGIAYPEEPVITVKVLWFTVFRKELGSAGTESGDENPEMNTPVKVPGTEKIQKEKSRKEKAEEEKKITEPPQKESTKNSQNFQQTAESDRKSANIGKTTAEINEIPPKESLPDRIQKWIEARRYQWSSICDKIKHIRRDFRYYWNIVSSPEFSDAVALILKKLQKLLPREWSAEGTLGLGDPEKAGIVLEMLGMTYPVTGGHVSIVPEFYLYQTDIAVRLKGKIRIITFALVLLDKNVRKVIRGFMRKNGKKEKKKHG